MSSRVFNLVSQPDEDVTDMSVSNADKSITTLVSRLPKIANNKHNSFTKLNRFSIQCLKDLTNLIDDVKGNLIPRHEILLILHTIVESLSTAVDVNSLDMSDSESENQEDEDAHVPREVQNWIQKTFMDQDDPVNVRKSDTKKYIFNPLESIKKIMKSKNITIIQPDDIQPEVKGLLDRERLWQSDVFTLHQMCGEQTAKVALNYYFQKYNLFNTFKIPGPHFVSLMNHITFGYERYNNPYHNIIHATDVLQTIHSLLVLNNFMYFISPLELLTSLFAATIHDYDHQGVTNNFIVQNKYQLALTYNDFAVQENHHVSAVFKLMRKPFLNICVNMTNEQFNEFRALCIKMVLSTDMSQHFLQLKKFNAIVQAKEFVKVHDYLSILLHTADLSNPAKEWNIHVRWLVYLFDEFFAQGDRERALGLSISPLCDRNSTLIYQSQIGFLDFIIQPTFDLLSNISEDILTQFKETSLNDLTKKLKSRKGTSNLVVQFKHCNNRPWEVCIMQNRSNWRRKGDKDYNEQKQMINEKSGVTDKPNLVLLG